MAGIIARILLRVLAGILLGQGVSVDLVNILDDPSIAVGVEAAIGAAIWGATEVWYWWTAPSKEALEVAEAVDKGQAVTVEGPRGGKTVVQKDVKP